MKRLNVGDYVLVVSGHYSFDETNKTIGKIVGFNGIGVAQVELVKWKTDKDGYPDRKIWAYIPEDLKRLTEEEVLVRMI